MKILIFLLIISISLSLSEQKKRASTSSDSSSKDSSDSKESSESAEDEKPKETSSEPKESNHTVLKMGRLVSDKLRFQGTLRQTFALEVASQGTENVVCSPVSALLPLGKLALGAEGDSLRELYKAIGVSGEGELSNSFIKTIERLRFLPGVKLSLASRIYVSDQAQLKSKFVANALNIFESSVDKISFANPKSAVDEINGWVSRQTDGLIPLLLNENQISPDSSLVLVNAVYFKGNWKHAFSSVTIGDFTAPSGIKKVPMMTCQADYNYAKSDILNAQIVEIPYEKERASFIIILPNKKDGLPLLLNQLKLAPNLLNDALLNLELTRVDLTIPKFTITTNLDLKNVFRKIGLKHMFETKSGLKGIVRDQELMISTAIQQAFIEVHEKGTLAAAASAIQIFTLSRPAETLLSADHPFLFYLRAHKEQLFSGVFSEP